MSEDGVLTPVAEYLGNSHEEMTKNLVKYGMISVIWIHIVIVVWTHWRQLRRMENNPHVPDEFSGFDYPPEGFRLSKNYSYQNLTLRTKKYIVRGVILTGILLSNGVATLWIICEKITVLIVALPVLSNYDYHPDFHTHLSNFIFTFVYTVLERAVSYWPELEEFDTERYFGFSRTSYKHWTKNFMRIAMLKVIVLPIYLEIAISVMEYVNLQMREQRWIMVLILGSVYWLTFPTFFVFLALSNTRQVKRLPDGDLKTRIDNLCDRVNFPKECIFVLHSTQAKNHPNAFHVKFLWYERLILFESLFEQHDESTDSLIGKGLSDAQVEAVVAHELGHYNFSHGILGVTYLQIKIWLSSIFSLWMMHNHAFHDVIGLGEMETMYDVRLPGLIADDLFISPYLLPIMDFVYAIYQRWTELKADEYAVKLGYGHQLESALVKISTDNFMFPDDDPIFTAVNCTHPSILTRMRNIRKHIIMTDPIH